ncbi:MAG: hypothetical protein Q9M89_04395 [Persephonella sp.]|nr:hypothetical protein [Persephonella sp.]
MTVLHRLTTTRQNGSVDVSADHPLPIKDVVTFEAGYIDYDYGNLHPNDGTAVYAQFGYHVSQTGIGD